ncbi:hypothetical protein C8K36_1011159 [Rhodococcus sp. OK519]|nr:hypothetical protein C8K36_1011159 [Rhodococcus sp. OK519]
MNAQYAPRLAVRIGLSQTYLHDFTVMTRTRHAPIADAVVAAPIAGHTDGMSDDDNQWYFSLSDGSVSQGKAANVFDRMGPYPDRESAERALQTAADRNKAADDADDEWNA